MPVSATIARGSSPGGRTRVSKRSTISQPRDPDRTDLEDRRALDVETRRLEIDDDEIRVRDRAIGDLVLGALAKIGRLQPVGEQVRRAVQRESDHATRERGIDRRLGREQLPRQLDDPDRLAALSEPME